MLEIPCWSLFETALESDGDCLNPLTDAQVVLELESPAGRQLEVDAFWDGGRTWRARFSPDEAGEWQWAWSGTGLSHSAGRGAFRCIPYHGDNPLYLHGAVRRSADRRHLAHADGTPFFWLADTAWNGVLRARESDWTRYLQTRRAQGFSAIQFVLTQWRGCRLDPFGETAFSVDADRLHVNPAFFQRMDPKVAAVNANGLVAAPVLLWALIDSDPGLALPEELAVRLARYLVARYGAYQLVWFLAGDGDYRLERAERWKRIGSAVFADRHDRLVTMHPTGMHWVAGEFRNEPWYDFIGYQSGHGDSDERLRWHVLGPPANDWATEPVLPVINLEPNYEAHISYDSANRFTDLEVRRATWWSCLNAPTAGVSYGHHAVWPWAEQPGPVDGHPSVGPAMPWSEALETEGLRSMTILKRFFAAIPWNRLRPAPEMLARQPGRDDPRRFIAAACTTDCQLAVIYIPAGAVPELTAEGLKSCNRARWFDPRTGKFSRARRPSARMRPPDDRDWVLCLERTQAI